MLALPSRPAILQLVRQHPFTIGLTAFGLVLFIFFQALGPSMVSGLSSPKLSGLGQDGSNSSEASTGERERWYIRDWPLSLGWNNIRYNIEASALQAKILGRTLVLPSFVYLRSCDTAHETCALYSDQVDRRVEIHNDQWNDEDAVGFRVPIETMFNLTHLSQVYTPIVTQSQFLARLSLPLSLERSDGQFVVGRDQALEDQIRERVSIFISPGAHYGTVPFTGDLPRILRVDRMPKAWSGRSTMSNEEAERAHQKLLTLRQKDGHVTYNEAAEILGTSKHNELKAKLSEIKWMMSYTFHAPDTWDASKASAWPEDQAIELAETHGWLDEYSTIGEDIFYLTGEIHDGRKAGFMKFSSPEARQEYITMTTRDLLPNDATINGAKEIAQAMRDKCKGRQYMSSHIRRGDFVGRLDWSPDSFDKHIEEVKGHLAENRRLLRERADEFKIPRSELPHDDDPFFVATDESDPNNLAKLRAAGAVLSSDLLTHAMRRRLGWPSLFGDVMSEVEQGVMARGAFFSASLRSSVPGWVINQRVGLGLHPDTTVLY